MTYSLAVGGVLLPFRLRLQLSSLLVELKCLWNCPSTTAHALRGLLTYTWTSASRLRFNPTKTEIMWLGAGQQVDINVIPVVFCSQGSPVGAWPWRHIRQSAVAVWPHCCSLSDWFLSATTDMTSYSVTHVTSDATNTIVRAFIACRLDWCNSLLYGVPENLLRKVQSVRGVYPP